MRAELTPAVVRALESLAADRANAIHLLLALLSEPEGRAAEILALGGRDLAVIRTALDDDNFQQQSPAVTVEQVLRTARTLAIETSGERVIGSEHVVAAILADDVNVRTTLESFGIDVAAIQTAARPATSPLQLDEPLDFGDPVERLDTTRILDAAGNRAREALRVIEDYCRFALDDGVLCRETKSLRHDLVEVLSAGGPLPLIESRDTLRDVGTEISTSRERVRESPQHVVQVNCKRLQEALRSLEEFGKLVRPELGATLEGIRYRCYTLEQAIMLGTDSRERLQHARLYLLVTGSACATAIDFLVAEAVAGGVDVIQMREKNLTDRELLDRACRLRVLTKQAGALFIVNDRPDIARLSDADGVHLGQDDMSVRQTRKILGPERIIGVSAHDVEQVRSAIRDGASYIGVGPVFPSQTKEFAEFPGLEFVRQAFAETTLPAFALGGITAENARDVVGAGATRLAVSAAICASDSPRAAAQALRRFV